MPKIELIESKFVKEANIFMIFSDLLRATSDSVCIIAVSLSASVSLKPSLDSTQSLQFSGWLLPAVETVLSGIMIVWHLHTTSTPQGHLSRSCPARLHFT